MDLNDKHHSIKRTSIIAFLSVAILITVCFALVGYNVRLQNNMLEASSVSYELRILLDRSNKQANLLFDPQSARQLSDRILFNIRKDFVDTARQVTKNNQRLRELLIKQSSGFASLIPWMDKEKMAVEMNRIDDIWARFQPRIEEIASYDTNVLRAGNKYWQPVDVSLSFNSDLFKSISKLNYLVYNSSLHHNQRLSILYATILIIVLASIWVIWGFTLMPLASSLKDSYDEIINKNQNLDYQANHDVLTGLLNRTAFNSKIREIEAQANGKLSCCLVLVDLDEFKAINDTLGHDVGDEVLKKVATNLRQSPMKGEDAYRLGGDEFALLIDSVERKQMIKFRLDQLLSEIREPLKFKGREVLCSCSLGVAVSGKGCGYNQKELFKAADTALYQVKDNGRNTYRFYDEVSTRSITEMNQRDSKLQAAVANEEFLVYYQEIVDIQDSSLCGFEALVRWNHPQKGILPAECWYEDAERIGLDSAITKQMVSTISRDLVAWKKQGLRLYPISVNITGKMLMNGHAGEFITEILRKAPNQARVSVEVAESMLCERSLKKMKQQLMQLRAAGIGITLDHFGTGQASLVQLREVPFDSIKIDQKFTSRASYDQSAKAFISSLVSLSEALNKSLICQGVEDEATRFALIELGCSHSQSFAESKALSFDNTVNLLRLSANLQVA